MNNLIFEMLWKGALHNACHERKSSNIDEVSSFDPDTATSLRELAIKYEYDHLMKLLSGDQ